MPFRYDRRHRRLHANCLHLDLGELQSLMQQAHREGLFARPLDAILCEMPDVTLVLRGMHLSQWLSGKRFDLRGLPSNDTRICRRADEP